VSGEGVQQSLLKLLEGSSISIPKVGLKKKPGGDTIPIDTTNILFICAGSFAGIEQIVEQRLSKSNESLEEDGDGFGHKVQNIDLIKFGLIPEFIGECST
jgi:ATP-dependent Clp protease ATP-binding subunit ClpX